MMRFSLVGALAFTAFVYGGMALADSSTRHSENVGAIWIPQQVPRVPFRDLFSVKSVTVEKKRTATPAPALKQENRRAKNTPDVITVPTLVGIALSDIRQAFFLQGTEHIIARDNDRISKRYRILKIEGDRVLLRDEQTGLERTILAN